VELKFTVTPEEAKPYLEKTVQEMSENHPIPGFRPGKAPYDEVKKTVGEMQIWQYALEKVVRAWFVKTVLQQNIETVGSPEIAVDQLTPDQDMKFTCTVAIMPKVERLETISAPFVEIRVKEVKDKDIDEAIEDIRKMRREEVVSNDAATKDHMVSLDLEMKKDNVILEGGTARGYRVYLNEDHYIPKFTEQLLGVKKGETKQFSLPFPETHYQKLFAGKTIDFDAKINDVYEIKLPEVNDEFAKTLGLESAKSLRDTIRKNLESEAERKAMDVAEVELLETLVTKSSFSDVPEILANEEVRRMYSELEYDIEHRGGRMADYLSSIKKTAEQIKLDMVPQAMNRVKTSILIREVAKQDGITVTDEEIDGELDRLMASAPDKESRERLASPEYREYVQTVMRNRKTLEALKQKGIKGYTEIMAKFAKEDAEHAHDHEHVHGPDCNHN